MAVGRNTFVSLFILTVHGVVNIETSPPLRLQAPGADRTSQTGCVQGSEVMGGVHAHLPPCPPWVDSEERCHMGDQILLRQQCLGFMSLGDYMALPRGRPETLPQPPAFFRPVNIDSNPPGWPSGGSPPGGWSPSHAPGAPGSHYGPPGTNTNPGNSGGSDALPPGMRNERNSAKNILKIHDGSNILPPSIRNLRRYSQTYMSKLGLWSNVDPAQLERPAPPSPPASLMSTAPSTLTALPAPSVNKLNIPVVRRQRRGNRRRKSLWFMRNRTGRRNRRRRNRRRRFRLGDSRRRRYSNVKLAAPPKFHSKM